MLCVRDLIQIKGTPSADIYRPHTMTSKEICDGCGDRMYFGDVDQAEICINAFFGKKSSELPNSQNMYEQLPSRREQLLWSIVNEHFVNTSHTEVIYRP